MFALTVAVFPEEDMTTERSTPSVELKLKDCPFAALTPVVDSPTVSVFAATITNDSSACEEVKVPSEWGKVSVPETVIVKFPEESVVLISKVLYVYSTFAAIFLGESGRGNTRVLNWVSFNVVLALGTLLYFDNSSTSASPNLIVLFEYDTDSTSFIWKEIS